MVCLQCKKTVIHTERIRGELLTMGWYTNICTFLQKRPGMAHVFKKTQFCSSFSANVNETCLCLSSSSWYSLSDPEGQSSQYTLWRLGTWVGSSSPSVCLSVVCLSAALLTQKRMIPKCSNLAYRTLGYSTSVMVLEMKGQRSMLVLGLTAIRRGFELYECLLVLYYVLLLCWYPVAAKCDMSCERVRLQDILW